MVCEASTDEVKGLRREVRDLKEYVADLTLEKRQPPTTKQRAASFMKTFRYGPKSSLVTHD